MATLTVNNEQLRLIQRALDLYSRIGLLQLDQILDHPTIDSLLYAQFRPTKKLEVNDRTDRGIITKITKTAIWTKGSWGGKEETRKWTDIENVKLSIDYSLYHARKDSITNMLTQVKSLVVGEDMNKNAYLGIHNQKVDESCRLAFDIIQKIRHSFWLADPDRNSSVVSSHVSIISNGHNVKVELDE